MNKKLATLKSLLGIGIQDNSKDIPLEFALDNTEEIIKNYCNIDEVPAELHTTHIRMAMDLYRMEQPGEEDTPLIETSVKEGDTTVNYSKVHTSEYMGSILKDYKKNLNRFRKVGFS